MFTFRFPYAVVSILTLLFLTGELRAAEIKKTALPLPGNAEDFQQIGISLLRNAAEIKIETASPYQIMDHEGRSLYRGDRIVAAQVKPNSGGIQIGSQTFQSAPLTIQSEGEGIKLGGRLYRHTLKIWREENGKLLVVNEIDLEDYLKGVLPWEANPKWSLEALKAQAVASRTYALFKAIENQKERFAVSKGMLSQVYGGQNSEDPITNRAVEATRGEILTYQGKIFPAYFHSTCGGRTTRPEYQWDVEGHPVLKGVDCSFCHTSKHYRWQESMGRGEIEKKLKKHGINAAGIKRMEPVDLDASGRARYFKIEWAGGKAKIRANDFRLWLNPEKLRSTLITSVRKEGENFSFKGRGWGHGVGMCQYGMKGLAELGYSYKEILKYYYPGAEVTTFGSGIPAPTEEKKGWWGSMVGKFQEELGF